MGSPNRNGKGNADPFRSNARPPLSPASRNTQPHSGAAASFRSSPHASFGAGNSFLQGRANRTSTFTTSRPSSSQFGRHGPASLPGRATSASTPGAGDSPNRHNQVAAQNETANAGTSGDPEVSSASDMDSIGRDAAPDFVVDQANAMREEADIVQEIMEHESAMVELEKKLETKLNSMIDLNKRAETKMKKYIANIVQMRKAEQEDFEEIDSMRADLEKLQSEHKEKVAQVSNLEEEKRQQDDASESAKEKVLRAIAEKAHEMQRENEKHQQVRDDHTEELRQLKADLHDAQVNAKEAEKTYALKIQEATECVQALHEELRKTKSQQYEELKIRARGISASCESVVAEMSSATSQLSRSLEIGKRATEGYGEFAVKMRELTNKSAEMLETRSMKVQEVRSELENILSNVRSSHARLLELEKENECVAMEVKSVEVELSKIKHKHGQTKSKYEEQQAFQSAAFERARNRIALPMKRRLDSIAELRVKQTEHEEEEKQMTAKCREVSQVLDARIRGLEQYVQRLSNELQKLRSEQEAVSKVADDANRSEKKAETKLLLLRDQQFSLREKLDKTKAALRQAIEEREELEASASVARENYDSQKKGQGKKSAKVLENLEELLRSEQAGLVVDKTKIQDEQAECKRLEKRIKEREQQRRKKARITATVSKSNSRVQGRPSKAHKDRVGRSTSPKHEYKKKKKKESPKKGNETDSDFDCFEDDIGL